MKTAVLAPNGLQEPTRWWVPQQNEILGDLFLFSGPAGTQPWAQNIWYDVMEQPIESIKHAVRILRDAGGRWAPYAFQLHRRMTLIQEQLPRWRMPPLEFPTLWPNATCGGWTLRDANTLVYAASTDSPWPNGVVSFAENHSDPPSRAYLKLWEVLTRTQLFPGPGEICMDLGASPGGWTWVLAKLGAKVIAVDRSPLDPRLMRNPGIEFRQASAFSMQPRDVESVSWIFSDVICYPERLLTFVKRWLDSGKCERFVCTLKFQGTDQYGVIQQFLDIPGSRVLHLYHNKHELTWVRHPANG